MADPLPLAPPGPTGAHEFLVAEESKSYTTKLSDLLQRFFSADQLSCLSERVHSETDHIGWHQLRGSEDENGYRCLQILTLQGHCESKGQIYAAAFLADLVFHFARHLEFDVTAPDSAQPLYIVAIDKRHFTLAAHLLGLKSNQKTAPFTVCTRAFTHAARVQTANSLHFQSLLIHNFRNLSAENLTTQPSDSDSDIRPAPAHPQLLSILSTLEECPIWNREPGKTPTKEMAATFCLWADRACASELSEQEIKALIKFECHTAEYRARPSKKYPLRNLGQKIHSRQPIDIVTALDPKQAYQLWHLFGYHPEQTFWGAEPTPNFDPASVSVYDMMRTGPSRYKPLGGMAICQLPSSRAYVKQYLYALEASPIRDSVKQFWEAEYERARQYSVTSFSRMEWWTATYGDLSTWTGHLHEEITSWATPTDLAE